MDLPYSLRIVHENLVRWGAPAEQVRAVVERDTTAEIEVYPSRVFLHDTNGVPVLADLAAMRDAMVELGGDPARVDPLVPAELVVDHSVIADVFGRPDALERNVELEYRRNGERYRFLRWGQEAFEQLKVVPPGAGIMHQVNLEQLARGWSRCGTGRCSRTSASGDGLAHDDGERARRAGLGDRRDRGRGRDARAVDVDGDPEGGRRPADRRDCRPGRRRPISC